MKLYLFLFDLFVLLACTETAQDGALLQKQPLEIADNIWQRIIIKFRLYKN